MPTRRPRAHVLVVPKEHYANFVDGVPGDVLQAMEHGVAEVARIKGLDRGFRVIMNTGAAAGQTVMHLHMHVLGGMDMSEGMIP